MSCCTYAVFMEDPEDPNVAYVKWPYGYAEVHGSRYGRDRNARLFAAALRKLALDLTTLADRIDGAAVVGDKQKLGR